VTEGDLPAECSYRDGHHRRRVRPSGDAGGQPDGDRPYVGDHWSAAATVSRFPWSKITIWRVEGSALKDAIAAAGISHAWLTDHCSLWRGALQLSSTASRSAAFVQMTHLQPNGSTVAGDAGIGQICDRSCP
jgi:hypothetical protein